MPFSFHNVVNTIRIERVAAALALSAVIGCAPRIPDLPSEIVWEQPNEEAPITLPEQQLPSTLPESQPIQPSDQALAEILEESPEVLPEALPPKLPEQPVDQAVQFSEQTIQRFPEQPAQQFPPPPAPTAQPEPLPIAGQAAWPIELSVSILHKADYNPLESDNGKNFRALINADIYQRELIKHSIETPKQVDFTSSQVLVSSAGQKPSGGYSVSVVKLEEFEDKIVATAVQESPGPGCITTGALSFPFEFIVVPSRKPIEIYERRRTQNC